MAMTMDDMELRLQAWGAWLAMGGKGGDGYPRTNCLHENWMPPAPGMVPGMKAARGDARMRDMHKAISYLSMRLANTLVVVYVLRVPAVEQALRLQCAEATVRMRVRDAKIRLRAHLEAAVN